MIMFLMVPYYLNTLLFIWFLICSSIDSISSPPIAIVGDIAPTDGISKLEKSRREREALEHMCKLLGEGPHGTFF